jgi:hypothetical protein
MNLLKIAAMSLMLICSIQTQANIITLEFEAVVAEGSFAGQSGFGSISYDDSNLPTTGEAFLGFSGGFFADFDALTDFTFTFLGQSYSATNDSDYPDLPLFSLFDNFADSLDFFVEDGIGADIADERILDIQVFGESFDNGLRDSANGYDFEVDLFVTERQLNAVSAPTVLPLFLFALGILASRKVAS